MSLATTQIYTMVSVEKLKQIHAVTHPARTDGAMREPDHADDAEVGEEQTGTSLLAAMEAEADEEVQ